MYVVVSGSSRKNIWGEGGAGWPLIIWEATTAKRNYYKTNYIKHVEKFDLSYPEKNFRRAWARFGGLVPPGPNVEPPLVLVVIYIHRTPTAVYICVGSTHARWL